MARSQPTAAVAKKNQKSSFFFSTSESPFTHPFPIESASVDFCADFFAPFVETRRRDAFLLFCLFFFFFCCWLPNFFELLPLKLPSEVPFPSRLSSSSAAPFTVFQSRSIDHEDAEFSIDSVDGVYRLYANISFSFIQIDTYPPPPPPPNPLAIGSSICLSFGLDR